MWITVDKSTSIQDASGPLGPMQFLEIAADEDVLRFMRRLPMIAGHIDGQFTMRDLAYEIELLPYVKIAWREVDGSPGIPGRLRQMADVYRRAEAEFEKETGKKRRLERIIDLPTFVEIYSTDGLP